MLYMLPNLSVHQNGSLNNILKIFQDSVTSVGFNKEGSLVATGDMSGMVRVWKMSNKSLLWEDAVQELTVRHVGGIKHYC